MLAFHIIYQARHTGFVLKSCITQLLLRHSIFFPQKDKDGPLLRSNLQTVLAEVTGQFSVDCGGNFTIQYGKDKPDVKVKLLDHEIIV